MSAAKSVARSLVFERNEGQHPSDVRFLARGAGYRVAMRERSVALAFAGAKGPMRIAISFEDARPEIAPRGESPATARANYFMGRDERSWRIDVPTFGHVRYPRAYDGIDLDFYGNGRQLEYDVVVAPGARPERARLRFDGADSARVAADGSLVLGLPNGELRFTKPIGYQQKDGRRVPVDVAYRTDGAILSFEAAAYDRSRELVIDPVLVFSTYLGGTGGDAVLGVGVDAAGATYATGTTSSTDFPLSSSVQPDAAFSDAFVTKFDRNGALVYSTYFGGSSEDSGIGVAIDAAGAAYVVGWTESPDLPISSGAFQRQSGGGDDAFVLKLAPAGNRIAYATYLGGDQDEPFISTRAGIAVDPTGIATVVSSTDSTNFPTTSGAFVRTQPGFREHGFVTRLNATGTGLIYSTLLGGELVQGATGVALDAQGRAIVVGYVEGAMPTTTTIGPGGTRDAYALKLNSTGSGLVFSTRFGGSSPDLATAVTYDPNRDLAYIAGITDSSDFPLNPARAAKGRDSFLFTLMADGTFGFFRTLLGGSQTDQAFGIGSSGDHITLFGTTNSADFPTVSPLQPYGGGLSDGFITRFLGTGPVFSTTIGGSGFEDGFSGVVDSTGAMTIGGDTSSTNFPVAHAAQGTHRAGADTDGFVSRVSVVPRGTPGPHDVVVHVADVATLHGDWEKVADATAAGGARLHNPDRGQAKVTTPLATPNDYFEFKVRGLDGGPYRMWMRGRADGDSYSNDSVWVQFERAQNNGSDADDERTIFRIGTTEAMAVVVEDCSNCGLRGWGWQDSGYGQKLLGTPLYFNDQAGTDITVRVQRREDGISIDQIVFAKGAFGEDFYFDSAPGYQKDDDTILPAQDPLGGGDAVRRAGDGRPHGTWKLEADPTAADGVKVRNADAGAPKLTTPLANPVDYFETEFHVQAGIGYRLWIRGRADADSYTNDSAYVQFDGAVDSAGNPIWRTGTTSATTYVLEDCNGCGVKGWGWNDNGYGTGVLGPLVYFAFSGTQRIVIQTREDGLAIDQIVLSPERYLTKAPGATKNDNTIVPR